MKKAKMYNSLILIVLAQVGTGGFKNQHNFEVRRSCKRGQRVKKMSNFWIIHLKNVGNAIQDFQHFASPTSLNLFREFIFISINIKIQSDDAITPIFHYCIVGSVFLYKSTKFDYSVGEINTSNF